MTKSPPDIPKTKSTEPAKNLKISRERTIIRAGIVTIITNFLLAGFKIIVGVVSNSLAIISDATHGLIDAISGVIVIIGEKLATHKKYAHNRHKIERGTTLAIAIIIIIVGIHIFIESVKEIINPEPVDYTLPTMIVLIASAVIKLFLSLYLRDKGRQVKANALTAVSIESLNDFLISLAVLASAIIYLIWQIDIEAYISILISSLIIKFGFEFISPNLFSHHHLDHKH